MALLCYKNNFAHVSRWPRGLMDKASDFGSEDCEFESRRGRLFCFIIGNSVFEHEGLRTQNWTIHTVFYFVPLTNRPAF